jgi:hypothetical protein
MRRFMLALLALVFVGVGVAVATGPYTGNTAGTDLWAILQALNDIATNTGSSGTGANVQASPGSNSTKAVGVQGVTGMTPVDTNLKQVGGSTLTEGQGTKSQSIPVTMASDQGQATASVAINVSSATTTQLVAISGSKSIYVSHYNWISGGTGNVTLEYGTGSTCGTGTTVLTGPYGMLAGGGISAGSGVAPILFVPAGNALCILTSTTAQISGSVAYAQP